MCRRALSAQPVDVRLGPLFLMRERTILDVEDAIREFEQSRVVGHDQDSAAVISGDAGEDGHDRLAVGAVERSGRLIGEDRGRLGNNRAGNRDALLVAAAQNAPKSLWLFLQDHALLPAAAQIARKRLGLMPKANAFEDLARFGLGAPALLAADVERQTHVLRGGKRGEQMKGLKNAPAVLRANAGELLRACALRRMSADEQAALGRGQHAAENR